MQNLAHDLICPVLLAGGSGTRLWPLSRKSYPKQFSKLVGTHSLFQKAAKRFVSSEICRFSEQVVITNSDFRFIVAEQMQSIGIDPGWIMIEPTGKNTAPAILAASLYQEMLKKGSIMLICPSDHLIEDVSMFHKAINIGMEEAKKKKVVTFGIKPDKPTTSYGYLEVSDNYRDSVFPVKKFIEKPNLDLAKKLFIKKNIFWNSGIFLFAAKYIIDLYEKYCPKMFEYVSESVARGRQDLGFYRLDEKSWEECENISFDYAIMEKIKDVVAVELSTGWSDLGNWEAVWEKQKEMVNGVVTSKNATAIKCENVLLRSENINQELVGIGLSNIVAISMHDAVLVANKDFSEDVKQAVKSLQTKGKHQADQFPKDFRPWGWFESIALDTTFQVKRILVKSKHSLSLQEHKYRSEHWIVVTGIAEVTLGDNKFFLSKGESTYIPAGTLHRLENPDAEILEIIEVQIGTYFGEDDIIRHEDRYFRK